MIEYALPVVGMQEGVPALAVVRIIGTDAEDLVQNLGTGPIASSHIENVAADAGDALGFAQPMLARLQCLASRFALGNDRADGDGEHR